MKLTSISVENYRSITNASKIRLGNTPVLVGPNNEGKSNVLLALVTAMNLLPREQYAGKLHEGITRLNLGRIYEWTRDSRFTYSSRTEGPVGDRLGVRVERR
jgi:ABC-type cobalamin transport system ATPase subunit